MAQSQSEMNMQAASAFKKADDELNKVYGKVLAEMDTASKEKLRDSQRLWVKFRDAEGNFRADLEARGGSMAPLILYGTMTDLTEKRSNQLRSILKESG